MSSEESKKKEFSPLSENTQTEDYFFKQDQALIAKLRAQADAERRARTKDQEKALHWMRCPKCGGQMQEIEQFNIRLDQCGDCRGIYFDAGELDILFKMQNKDSFFSKLMKGFK